MTEYFAANNTSLRYSPWCFHPKTLGALREIEAAQERSAKLHGYARSSPQLLLWGVLWVIGYGLNDFFPAYSGAIWSAVVPIGLIAGFAALRGTGHEVGLRYGAG